MRSHFSLEPSVCYLDAASITPRASQAASEGRAVIGRSEQPWRHRARDKAALAGDVRKLAASALGASATDIALTNAVSYGMATAAANLPVHRGSRVLVLQDDHPSSALIWRRVAAAADAFVDTVARPPDGDWTAATLERLDSGPPVSVAVLSPVHWTDGSQLDIARIAPEVRRRGAALVIDATQAVGVMELDAPALDADFVTFPAYKWMMGPYGLAFLYAHPRHHQGCALEEHMSNRKAPALKRAGPAGDFSHVDGASRYDRGERDDELLLSIAARGLALAMSVPRAEKQSFLWRLNDRLTDALRRFPVAVHDRRFRCPHILGIDTRERDAVDIATGLEQRSVYVSPRRGYLRVSPYIYNDEADIDRFVAAIEDVTGWR